MRRSDSASWSCNCCVASVHSPKQKKTETAETNTGLHALGENACYPFRCQEIHLKIKQYSEMPFLINLSNTNLIIDFSTNLYQYLT